MTRAVDDADAERLAERAAALLGRPGAWLDAAGDGYLVRLFPDRRRRAALTIDEAAFRRLVREPGLKPLPGGGWRALLRPADPPSPPPGRPGVVLGERTVADASGRFAARTVNLGESPVMQLLRRGWLTPAEAAAGERLRDDFQRAGTVGRLTMSWDAGPKGAGGRGAGADPAERARGAKDRIARALAAAGPGLKEVLEQVCLAGTALQAAERELGLPRRSGKAMLKLALARIASVYGLG